MAVLPAIGSILNTAIRSDHLEDIAYGLNEIVGLAKRVSDEEWSGRIGLYISMLYNFNIYRLGMEEFLDSLSVSNHAYNSLRKHKFDSAIGRPDMDTRNNNLLNGRKISPLEGQFWFPESARKHPVPQSGKVTLIVPFQRTTRAWGTFAGLRRLSNKVPDLEVVVHTNTLGHFFDQEPPQPGEEAKLLDELRRFYGIPGMFAVTETEFWRLPDNDRRRINTQTANEKNEIAQGIILVDKEGRQVFAANSTEKELEYIIPILLNRPYSE